MKPSKHTSVNYVSIFSITVVVQQHKISFECARTYTTLGVCHLMERVLLNSLIIKMLIMTMSLFSITRYINPLNAELNPVCCLLALLGAHHFLHVSRIRVKSLTFRRLMSYVYIYGAPILDVSRSHTTTHHSR